MRCLWRTLPVPLSLAFLIGCGGPPLLSVTGGLRFSPTEPISASNSARLGLVFRGTYADYLLENILLAPEHGGGIMTAGVDSDRQELIVHHNRMTSFRSIQDARIERYSLRTGLLSGVLRIPSGVDLSGSASSSYARVVYDFARRRMVMSDSLAHDNTVFEVALDRDSPRMLARGAKMGSVSAGGRFLVFYESSNVGTVVSPAFSPASKEEAGTLLVMDVATDRIDSYPLADVGRDLGYVGATQEFVVGLRTIIWPHREVYVLKRAGLHLEPVNRVAIEDGWVSGQNIVDPRHRRWLVAEHDPRGCERLRAYSLPDLKVALEMPDLGQGPVENMLYLDQTDLLAIIRKYDPERIHIYELMSGRQVGTVDLRLPVDKDWGGSWRLFTDQENIYVGAHGSQYVQLFAVRPGDRS